MIRYKAFAIVATSLIFSCCSVGQESTRRVNYISPNDFGLAQAKTGEERFEVLYKAHSYAASYGYTVNYEGIDHIDLVIPRDAKSIPLSYQNDFSGVVFNVLNNNKNLFLFSLIQKPTDIVVDKKDLDDGVFNKDPVLSKGRHLLSITDKNPWVETRSGYSYGHSRRDVMLIEQGQAKNKTSAGYNNAMSSPSCKCYSLPDSGVILANITLNRKPGCTNKTYLCSIIGYDNVTLENVSILTPNDGLTDDLAIKIEDCTNVHFDNILINGTYSRKDHSGYGASLNNVWNFRVHKMTGKGNWGVFGNNNINTAILEECELNRFDIHCYGRDVEFRDTKFFDMYNQFSSVFGFIRFYNCSFTHFIPVLYESSYNASVGHDVLFKDCTFYLDKANNYLIRAGTLTNETNTRRELSEKCWPNVTIQNMSVVVADDTKEMNIFQVSKEATFKKEVSYFSNLTIKGLIFSYLNARPPIILNVSNKDIVTKKNVTIQLDQVFFSNEKRDVNGTFQTHLNKGLNKNHISVKRSSILNPTTLK